MRNNKEFILELLEQKPSIYKSYIKVGEHLYEDKEFCIKLLEYAVVPLEILKTFNWSDKSFVLEVYRRCPSNLWINSQIDKELYKDRDVLIELLKKDHFIFRKIPEELKNDRELLLTIVKSNAIRPLSYASDELIIDREIALEAIKRHDFRICYKSIKLMNDKSFFLEAVEKNGFFLEFGSEKGKMLDDNDKVDGKFAEKYSLCKSKFNADKEIVLVALNQNIKAIDFVDESLLDDADVVNVINNHIQKLNVSQ